VRDRDWSTRFAFLGISLVAFTALIVPWIAFNMQRFEEPVFLTSNTGEALLISNCNEVYYGTYLGSFSGDCRRGRTSGDASERDLQKRERAVDYIEGHTRRLPIVVLAREGRTWGVFRPWQQADLDTVRGSSLWVTRSGMIAYWVLLPFAVIGFVAGARRRLPIVVLLAFMATAAIGTALAFGQTRYRAPAEIPIVVAASIGIDAVIRRWRPENPEFTSPVLSEPQPTTVTAAVEEDRPTVAAPVGS
jgi:hypothetical protein